ncbi:uncharacterized protein LOC110171065 [Boleophthalmus pectinirostris]|uniref:uncharacterized protein LOC110171065 n=1 Tax=Boleophthalmus pectinirostris TaxID=150288 RepID=UPI00242FB821|nr:uncharacterized protein LOC110171065 [Boleophthalmus pectinirostris]
MWKSRRLRVLVQERLCAAAEEIFALFEATIAEYEEEVRRSKNQDQNQDQDQRTRDILDSALSLSISPGPGLDQDTARVKEDPEEPEVEEPELEEPRVKQEDHRVSVQISMGVSESSAAFVKTEESPLLQQRQTEPSEDTQGEDVRAELHSPSEHLRTFNMDYDEDWTAPLRCSAPQMKTEADGDFHDLHNLHHLHQPTPDQSRKEHCTNLTSTPQIPACTRDQNH